MGMTPEEILKGLTLEEKIALVAGTEFMHTNPIPRVGIEGIHMSDGPHGLRVQTEGGDNGVTASLPATSFPTASAIASTWDPELAYEVGQAISREAHHYDINVVLGPGANIKRSPTGGRNFEYFSEDPLLSGTMAGAEIRGIQSGGVGACMKHFALNNCEDFRNNGNSIVDERAMREIYLKSFEIAVKDGRPSSLMCAYNQVNGVFCSENAFLLTEVLREDWGFDGLVMTDWGAMHSRAKAIEAGLDLEMPGDTPVLRKELWDAIKNGTLSEEALDKCALRVLNLCDRFDKDYEDDCDFSRNHEIACKVATEGAVLLKNDGVLPLKNGQRVLVVGELFTKMRYQGSGSSMINPTKIVTPEEAFKASGVSYRFVPGYCATSDKPNEALAEKALSEVRDGETVLCFAGLIDSSETEGKDREDMFLPENQLALIEGLLKKNASVVLVLFGGSSVELPWEDKLSAVLLMNLPGQAGGEAVRKLLFGEANPSGRLSETWRKRYADTMYFSNFSKERREIYKESVFVGYRNPNSSNVRHPFGFGLSYTTFEWEGIELMESQDSISVKTTVTNKGAFAGKDVVQLYCSCPGKIVFRPKAELVAFSKAELAPGESKDVVLSFKKDSLRYWNVRTNGWEYEEGEYRLSLRKDALHETGLECAFRLKGTVGEAPYDNLRIASYFSDDIEHISDEEFSLLGVEIPKPIPVLPITIDSKLSDLKHTFMGRILRSAVLGVAKKQLHAARKLPEGPERDNKVKGARFLHWVLENNSLNSMTMCAGTQFPYNFALGFVELSNGHLVKGARQFLRKIEAPRLPKEDR